MSTEQTAWCISNRVLRSRRDAKRYLWTPERVLDIISGGPKEVVFERCILEAPALRQIFGLGTKRVLLKDCQLNLRSRLLFPTMVAIDRCHITLGPRCPGLEVGSGQTLNMTSSFILREGGSHDTSTIQAQVA
ncbi:MAG: hypothetical protein ABIH46_11575 [Chloroflexota bacterium]